MSTNTPDANILLHTGEFTEAAGDALARARELAESVAADQIKRAEITPAVMERLQQAGLVPEAEREEVLEKLSSHAGALMIIGRMADMMRRRKEAQVPTNAAAPSVGSGVSGSPGAEAAARDRGLPPGSAPSRYDIRPSDRPLLELLNSGH